MEKECKIIDLKITVKTDEAEEVIECYEKLEVLQKDINNHINTIEQIQESAAIEISKNKEKEEEITDIFKFRIDHFYELIKLKVSLNSRNIH